MRRLDINESRFGTLISIFTMVCVATSLFLGILSDIVGFQPMLIFGFLLTALSISIIAVGESFAFVAVACALMGLGAMSLNIIGNTLAMVTLYGGQNTAAASNVSNIFFGLGIFLTPIITSTLFKTRSYRFSITSLSIFFILPGIAGFFVQFPVIEAGFDLANALLLLKDPTVLFAGLTLFFYVGMESSFINWLPKIGSEVLESAGETPDDTTEARSMKVLSIFAVFLMIGRLIASQIPSITAQGEWYIIGASVLSAGIIVALKQTTSLTITRILAAAAGFAFAPIFPTTVGITFAQYDQHVYGSIFGILGAIGLFGAVVGPKSLGVLAQNSSVQKSLYFLLPACGILIILAYIIG
jgi:fucose permease